MLPKPLGCRGCPYDSTNGFVPDDYKPGAAVCVMLQNPGEQEEDQGIPAIGEAGRLLNDTLLPLAGLDRSTTSVSNALRCRIRGSNKLPPVTDPRMQAALAHCHQAHFNPPASTRVYVAAGEYAVRQLTDISYDWTAWRGYIIPRAPRTQWGYWDGRGADPVLVTLHPAYLFRDPDAHIPIMSDWGRRLPALLAGTWPVSAPEICTVPPEAYPPFAGFDTEYEPIPGAPRLIRYSVAWRIAQEAVVHVVEATRHRPPSTPPTRLVGQNAPVDIPHTRWLFSNHQSIEWDDTMYAHSVLWTGATGDDDDETKRGSIVGHGLNYLGSLYGPFNRWKHLGGSQPILYAGLDPLGAYDIWHALLPEFKKDPLSWNVYQQYQRPLIPIIARLQEHGIAVDTLRVAQLIESLAGGRAIAEAKARASAGWPLKISSPKQIAAQLQVEKVRRR